ncbi:MAG: glycosyltransferase [Candidatus Kapaibacteriota bacterium]
MRIAYLSTFYPFRGGIAQFNARLLKHLSKFGEVRAYTFKRQYPRILFPGRSQYVLPEDKPEVIESIQILDSINPISYYKTAKAIKSYAPDILITKYWMPFFAPAFATVLKSLKRQTFNVSIIDNISPHERFPFAKTLNKFYLKQNHVFIVMSNAVLRDLKKILTQTNYVLVPHPLYENFGERIEKPKARNILQISDNRKVLLFFGFIREYKGLDLLLEALAMLPEEYHLIIAGEPYVSFEKYQAMIENLNLKGRVSLFVRYISDAEVPLFFSAADVCILPYKSATQSGIVGIAYNFDLPVIATDVGGLAEMVEPFGTGIIVKEPEPKRIANAITLLFENPREEYIKGIKKYKSQANWDFFASKIIQEYNYFKAARKSN